MLPYTARCILILDYTPYSIVRHSMLLYSVPTHVMTHGWHYFSQPFTNPYNPLNYTRLCSARLDYTIPNYVLICIRILVVGSLPK